jgi:hypothetical protein
VNHSAPLRVAVLEGGGLFFNLKPGDYPMSRIVTKTVYRFDELSDEAKEKAREWYREGNLDHDWWDGVYDMWTKALNQIGFSDVRIYFSGFSSQGDGACFVARIDIEAVLSFMSTERTASESISFDGENEDYLGWVIHEIGFVPEPKFARLLSLVDYFCEYGPITHTGRYHHEQSVSYSVDMDLPVVSDGCDKEGWTIYVPQHKRIGNLLREFRESLEELRVDLCMAIYKTLENEYEFLQSDEVIDESMEANEYEFDEDGNPA